MSQAMARETALVTGATSGIGLELSRQLAQSGHDLVLVARDGSALGRTAEELRAAGVAVEFVVADLSSPGAPAQVFDAVAARGISIDVLVNNAGCGLAGGFATLDLAAQLAMVQVNATALVHLTGLFLPVMLARRHGHVLNLASIAAFQPLPGQATYAATKAFVLSFSSALNLELAGSGVGVTALCPGPTATRFAERAGAAPLFRGARAMSADEVARAGLRALHRGAPLAVPGLRAKLLVAGTRLLPRALVGSMVRRQAARAGRDAKAVGAPPPARRGR
jgi:short-subunit dehydrogenase